MILNFRPSNILHSAFVVIIEAISAGHFKLWLFTNVSSDERSERSGEREASENFNDVRVESGEDLQWSVLRQGDDWILKKDKTNFC